ncbi:MAG: inositol monophosphatase family protein [Gemmatimonadota bacterium]
MSPPPRLADAWLDDALVVAREAAAEGLAVIRDAWGASGRQAAREKQPRDLVTATDLAAQERIVTRLVAAYPDWEVAAEEATSTPSHTSGRGAGAASRYCWSVDPLDGTTNFVHGLPAVAISIALLADHEPVAGVVVDVVRGEWFTARAGAGAWLDEGDRSRATRLVVAEAGPPGAALVATGFPFRQRAELDRYLGAFRAVFTQIGDMRRAGSAALDLAYVAAGRLDGFWELGLSPWDTAAGELLVLEAGGRVSDWSGGATHRDRGWIAAGTPAVHGLLVDTLREFA